jgi:hypothetical protein
MAFPVLDVWRRIPILAAVCVVSCAAVLFAQTAPESSKVADYEDADGYSVLSVLLDHEHSASDHSFQISPITASGMKPDSFQSCTGRIPAEFSAAVNDFRDKNRQNWHLSKKFNLKFGYKFADLASKRQPLAPTPNAKELPPALFDDRIFEVSAVGFDASRTHAIAYVAVFCGPDCTSAAYHLLVKEKEGWKEFVSSPVCQWMSFNADTLFDWSAV